MKGKIHGSFDRFFKRRYEKFYRMMWAEYQWNYNLLAMIGKHQIFDWFIRCLKCVLDYLITITRHIYLESDKMDIDSTYERMMPLFQYNRVVVLKNHKEMHATKRGIKTNKSQSNLRKLVCSSPISSKSNDLANRANF